MTRSQSDLMINGLLLGKPESQSGVYYFANLLIEEIQKTYPDISILVSRTNPLTGGSVIKVPSFPLKFRFLFESYYRLKYRKKYWLNLDYFLPFRFGVKCLGDGVVIHDFLVYDKPYVVGMFRKLWIHWQFRRTANFAEKIITISDFSAERFCQLFPIHRSKCSVIPVPIDLARFNELGYSERLNLQGNQFLLTISSPWQHKNLAILDQVMPLIYANYGVSLIKVGARQKRIELVDFKFDDRAIHNLGYVTDGILGQLLKSCRAVIAPSTYEGFGMTVYESLGLGVPVIATDLESYPKVSSLVRVVDPLSSLAWQEAISNFLVNTTTNNHEQDFDISAYSSSRIAMEYVKTLTED
jgi:glycosyltransferase involved in cell wall biosynthesis